MFSSQVLGRISAAFKEQSEQPERSKQREVEIRFGRLNDRGKIDSNITWDQFTRVQTQFQQKTTPSITHIHDEIMDSVRLSFVEHQDGTKDQPIAIVKTRDQVIPNTNYEFLVTISTETVVAQPIPWQPTLIRDKTRYSFPLFGNKMRLDLTRVETISTNQRGEQQQRTSYECELELLDPTAVPQLETATRFVLQQLQDTLEVYTVSEKQAFIRYLNNSLDRQTRASSDRISNKPLVQARNLRMNDCTHGGLTGNPNTIYSLSHKVDGVRKLLVINDNGIWLASPPSSVTKVTSLNAIRDEELRSAIQEIVGTILDGELVPPENRLGGAPNATYWYIPFDCLCTPQLGLSSNMGSTGIQQEVHTLRLNACQIVADRLKNNMITVNTKNFRTFTQPSEFFGYYRQFLAEQPSLQYKQDGMVVTPVQTEYNPRSDRYPLTQRVLTRYPDICKIKPVELLTIDLSISYTDNPDQPITLLSNNRETREMISFTGTPRFPYNNRVDMENPLLANVPEGTVVEFAWSNDMFVPTRIRFDKPYPNNIDIAQDTWTSIHQPLTSETLSGDTFTFVRNYHNKIKRELLSLVNVQNPTLLDIGSGRGGDIAKWRNYSHVIAVEPYHYNELEERITNSNTRVPITVLPVGAEETEYITQYTREALTNDPNDPNGKADVVALMLSLSFFWQSAELLDALVQTIVSNLKPDGKIIFLTIDGDLVEQVFNPDLYGPSLVTLSLGSGTTGSTIQVQRFDNNDLGLELGPAQIIYVPGNDQNRTQVRINIQDSIVQDQTEWLVHLNDLQLRLANYGYHLDWVRRADKEQFLSEKEMIFTSMYSYGIFSGKSEPKEMQMYQSQRSQQPVASQPIETLPQLVPTIINYGQEGDTNQDEEYAADQLPDLSSLDLSGFDEFGSIGIQQPVQQEEQRLVREPIQPPQQRQQRQQNIQPLQRQPIGQQTGQRRLRTSAVETIEIPVQTRQPTQVSGSTSGSTTSGSTNVQRRSIPRITQQTQQTQCPVVNETTPRTGTNELASLRTVHDPVNDVAVGDDAYEPLPIPNFNAVRIACLGDGSCFFHSILKAYSPLYANNPSYNYRQRMVKDLRSDLAEVLQFEDPSQPGRSEAFGSTGRTSRTYYETANNGVWLELAEMQGVQDNLGQGIDYSLQGIYNLLKSDRDIGDELYGYVSDMLGIDIYVVRPSINGFIPHITTANANNVRPAVVIGGNGRHYETIGVQRKGSFFPNWDTLDQNQTYIQTVFWPDDPFLQSIQCLFAPQ